MSENMFASAHPDDLRKAMEDANDDPSRRKLLEDALAEREQAAAAAAAKDALVETYHSADEELKAAQAAFKPATRDSRMAELWAVKGVLRPLRWTGLKKAEKALKGTQKALAALLATVDPSLRDAVHDMAGKVGAAEVLAEAAAVPDAALSVFHVALDDAVTQLNLLLDAAAEAAYAAAVAGREAREKKLAAAREAVVDAETEVARVAADWEAITAALPALSREGVPLLGAMNVSPDAGATVYLPPVGPNVEKSIRDALAEMPMPREVEFTDTLGIYNPMTPLYNAMVAATAAKAAAEAALVAAGIGIPTKKRKGSAKAAAAAAADMDVEADGGAADAVPEVVVEAAKKKACPAFMVSAFLAPAHDTIMASDEPPGAATAVVEAPPEAKPCGLVAAAMEMQTAAAALEEAKAAFLRNPADPLLMQAVVTAAARNTAAQAAFAVV